VILYPLSQQSEQGSGFFFTLICYLNVSIVVTGVTNDGYRFFGSEWIYYPFYAFAFAGWTFYGSLELGWFFRHPARPFL
jgi:hypothetical protein